ncbi:MAG: hypothetical protein AABY22_29525 [Nanoarchaeota archaeon]
MKAGERALKLSKKLFKQLRPYCKRIEIAGSIRRGSLSPGDIDIVLIPKDKEKLENFLKKEKYIFIQGGEKESTWLFHRIKIELYYTNEQEWGAALLAYSGRRGSNIGLRIIARLKGLKLTQHGLFNRRTGKRIAGKTEREIYKALNRRYKEPWER